MITAQYRDMITELKDHLVSKIREIETKKFPVRVDEYWLRTLQTPGLFLSGRDQDMSQVVMGIDWGLNESWLVVIHTSEWFTGTRISYMERITGPHQTPVSPDIHPHVARLAEIAQDYRPDLIITDIGSIGKDRHASLRRHLKFRYRTMEGQFDSGVTNRKGSEDPEAFTLTRSRVKINKAKAFQDLCEDVTDQRIMIPEERFEQETIIRRFMEHHLNVELRFEINPKSGKTFPFLRRIGRREDHLIDAHLMARAGLFAIGLSV